MEASIRVSTLLPYIVLSSSFFSDINIWYECRPPMISPKVSITAQPTDCFSQQDMHRFGGAIDSAEGAGLMIVGDEFSEING